MRAFRLGQLDDLPLLFAVLVFMLAGSLVNTVRADDYAEMNALFKQGQKLFDERKFAESIPIFERAVQAAYRSEGQNSTNAATVSEHLAEAHFRLGNFDQGEKNELRCLAIYMNKHGARHVSTAQAASNLAAMYYEHGDVAKAEPYWLQCLRVFESQLGQQHELTARTLNHLGLVYDHLARLEEAEKLFLRSIKIREALFGANDVELATYLGNLASLYSRTDREAEGIPLLLRSIKIIETRLGPESERLAAKFNNLGSLYLSGGDLRDAELALLRSRKIYEAAFGPQHSKLADVLQNLSIVYFRQQKWELAEDHYRQTLAVYEANYGPDNHQLIKALNSRALLYEAMGKTNLAVRDFDRLRHITRSYVANVLTILSDHDQLNFIQHQDRLRWQTSLWLAVLHRDQPSMVETSLAWIANAKAMAQETLAERTLLTRDMASLAMAAAIKELNALRSQIAKLTLAASQADEQRRELNELVAREAELAARVNRTAGRAKSEATWITSDTVRSAVPAKSVLLDMARVQAYEFTPTGLSAIGLPEHYVVWVVPSGLEASPVIIDLGEAQVIDHAIGAARRAIQSDLGASSDPAEERKAEEAVSSELRKLAQLLIAPLQTHLEGSDNVIVSPDSNLWLVPWGALKLDDNRYAVEAWPIRLVTSSRELVAEKASVAAKRAMSRPVIFADPDFDLDDRGLRAATQAVLRERDSAVATRSDLRAQGMSRVSRLPGTAVEAKLITPALEKFASAAPTLYTQRYALEGVVKAVASPRVMAISTHGFYSPGTNTTVANPLLRCGLLLAGCNESQTTADDGILTGMEILGCDLRGTELVVLSACETGLGQLNNGEGVVGLRQAFQLAGAKSVVSTLWRIPDKETSELMYHFFEQLSAGKTKAEALRNAQLKLIEARRELNDAAHPFYWAAFTVTGQ